jgi:CRP-like cAMP-binding protein
MITGSQAHATTMPIRQSAHPGVPNLLVRKLEGLVPLSSSDIAALESVTSQPRGFEPYVDLIQEGAAGETTLIVLEGFACHYKQRQAGARQILGYLLPGDVCDADAADLGPWPHAIGTLSSCVVSQVPRQALSELMQQHPSIMQGWRRMKRIEVDTAWAWIVNLGSCSALERMAHLFCELMIRMETVGLAQESTCPLPLTQVELGQTLGLSNVHVNRVLQEMRREGLIELKGKRLQIFDMPRLKRIAEFDPSYLQVGTRMSERKAAQWQEQSVRRSSLQRARPYR